MASQSQDPGTYDPRMHSDDALTTGRYLARERRVRRCVEQLTRDSPLGTFVIDNVNVIPRFDSPELLHNVDVTVETGSIVRIAPSNRGSIGGW